MRLMSAPDGCITPTVIIATLRSAGPEAAGGTRATAGFAEDEGFEGGGLVAGCSGVSTGGVAPAFGATSTIATPSARVLPSCEANIIVMDTGTEASVLFTGTTVAAVELPTLIAVPHGILVITLLVPDLLVSRCTFCAHLYKNENVPASLPVYFQVRATDSP